MKYLLIAVVVLGLIYWAFLNSKESVDSSGSSESLSQELMYQKEMEKVKAVEVLLQETVDQRLDEMDQVK